jgi:predicted ATP pyrophosphatase (TIGR00289 family)
MVMKVAALCSGGKDSTFALWLAMKQGHEINSLVAMIPKREDSWMFHSANIHLIDFFAECSGIPLVKVETSGEREKELKDLKHALQKLDVEGVISGAIASKYQKSRIDGICNKFGLIHLAPLWGRDPLDLLNEMVGTRFEAVVTSVAAEGFDEKWLGRKIDEKCVKDLAKLHEKFRINVCGEGGEYESLVLDAPFFGKRIELVETQRIWKGTSGYLLVKRAEVVEK